MSTGCGSQAEPVAKVVSVNGDVKLCKDKDSDLIVATVDASIFNHGIIRTGEQSSAAVKVMNKGTINFKSDVTFKFENISEADVAQETGTAIYKIEKNGKGFRAKTPQGVCCVLGTVFSLVVSDESVDVWVKEGVVEFTTNSGEKNKVTEGQKLVVSATGRKSEVSEPGLVDFEALFSNSADLIPFNSR